MKSPKHLQVAALAAAALGVFGGLGSAIASTASSTNQVQTQTSSTQLIAQAQQFGEQPILDASRMLLVAAPGSALNPHQFFIIEQQSNARPCWNEPSPGTIDPLWTTFDFTGICGRVSDSNGYSIRTNGIDQGANYQFKLEPSGNDLVLYGLPRPTNPDRRRLVIGRTNGRGTTGFTRINLEPGWSLARRTFEGRNLGHIYTTNQTSLAQLLNASGTPPTPGTGTQPPVAQPPVTQPPVTRPPATPAPFPDVQGNLYASLIARASELKLISGFEDGSFRPRNTLTREQAVSIVIEGLRQKAPESVLATLPQAVSSSPFPDVAANRWSALKIAQAKQLGIVAGDFETGRFRPSDNVTRAELVAMLRKAAMIQMTGQTTVAGTPVTSLVPTQSPVGFTDISGHWAANTITELSAYCGIASPLNETGTSFAPNSQALRDYASAAVVRWVDCQATQRGV
jgi:N-acetylmuramoyl-L-alanine amidase